MERPQFSLLVLVLLASAPAVFCDTNAQDAAALQALMRQWTNYPSSWTSVDPCGGWKGIMCSDGKVTSLKLPGVRLEGILSSSIGQLSQLVTLRLSSINLQGTLSSSMGCSLSSSICKPLLSPFTGICEFGDIWNKCKLIIILCSSKT